MDEPEAPSCQWLVNKNHDTGRLGYEGIHAQRAGPDLEPAEHAAARMTRRNLLRVTGPRTFATKEMDLSRIPGLGSLAQARMGRLGIHGLTGSIAVKDVPNESQSVNMLSKKGTGQVRSGLLLGRSLGP
jgi:hypothetical protein